MTTIVPVLRPLQEADIGAAEALFRRAFATEFGLAASLLFRPDARLVTQRFRLNPDGALGLEAEGELVGFALVNRWGAFGVLGPVCVDPAWWNGGLARKLLVAAIDVLDHWGCAATGLFTNPSSPRHFRLYESFGFTPGPITVILEKKVQSVPAVEPAVVAVTVDLRDAARRMTATAMGGLALDAEMTRLATTSGDVLARMSGDGLDWFAVLHRGVPSEAEGDEIYVKFAQIAGDAEVATARLDDMLATIEAYAAAHGAERITLGVSIARSVLYRRLLAAGYRGRFHGVHMVRGEWPDHTAHILEDWR